jgi:hypothetical protein
LQTYYGKASSGWKLEGNKIIMDIEIPANTTQRVCACSNKEAITESGNAVSSSKDLQVTGTENGYVILKVNSGKYHFEVSK